ncbi:uncharacterized protein LOC141967842 [Athene noctua]|uniref:uncharacterized protein LOC141967842 n=1 Tax=Athene noctua TaxID=126797 RepID=UPI003EC13A96
MLLEPSTWGSLMDSPCFTGLCFLLLTTAAPHPNVAMPSGVLAERTEGSSFGKTSVTVYHCKDCESKICKLSNYEDFIKIGETENEKFSNERIQLVTTATHIIMCFQQENTPAEGVYAIVWEKAVGVGESCGILNSGASSEDRRGDIIIEENKICCEAEINLSVPNSPLKCYTRMSEEKSTTDITGNPQFSISKESRAGIIILVLFLGVCAAVAAYCVRQIRNRRDALHFMSLASSTAIREDK